MTRIFILNWIPIRVIRAIRGPSPLRLDHPKLRHLPGDLDGGPLLDTAVTRGVAVLGIELGPQSQSRSEALGLAGGVTLDRFDVAADGAEHAGNAPGAERPPRVQ